VADDREGTPGCGYVALGANLGDPSAMLARATSALDGPGLRVLGRARLFRTRPVGPIPQPDFLNTVVEVESTLSPLELLDRLLQIETTLGRVRAERWGPRLIDLDLLALGTAQVQTPRLTLPHPELARRAFVLVPWAELAPGFVVPGTGRTVAQLLAALAPGPDEVIPLP
jgi:2-amino-4-hydroxy-6-hydroxymethyldihydropteridine diphosphokinase